MDKRKVKKGKGFKLFLSIIIFIIAAVGVFITLLFWDSSYTVSETKVSAALVDKIREVQKQGGALELNKEELNQIISMYFKGKSSGDIQIKAIDGDMENNDLKFNVPVNYKGFNVLMSSEGWVSYENNKIQYKPLYFKVGKISIPKSFVLNTLKNHVKKSTDIQNDIIRIDKNVIPIGIKAIQIKNNKLLITVDKINLSLEDKLKAMAGAAKDANSSNAAGGSASTKANTEGSSSQNGGTKGSSSSQNASGNSNSSSNNKDTSEMDTALNRISGGLSSAMGSVSTGGQKSVISQMMGATNFMKGNPSADPYSAAGGVRGAYSKLSPNEKAELKSAVFSNINGNDVNIVSKMIGK